MLFITLALSLILVALIVFALKKHQQRRLDDLAERDHSLPPLDIDPEASASTAKPEPELSGNAAPVGTIQETPKDWKEKCKALRQAQQYELALASADQAWPQSQSYEQAAITIRAALKQTPGDDSANTDRWLSNLYRAAAEFSFLYDKAPGEPELRWQTIARSYPREELSRIELPWTDIGADQLRLLTKTDRKLMIQAWGEPRQHVSAKTWYKQKSGS